MKPRTNIVITLLTVLALFIALVNVPTKYFSLSYWQNEAFGAVSLTDITSTDTISAFPTVQNNNNTIIENQLNNLVGTTTSNQITSLPNLVTVGTIGTGTWNADTIGIAKGGTNLTSYSQWDLIYASAANTLARLAASSTDEVLTYTSAGIEWRDAVVNLGNTYDWTAAHTWAAGATFNSTVDIEADAAANVTFNTVGYEFPSAQGASSTVISNNGSGVLSWQKPSVRQVGRTELSAAANTVTVSGIPQASSLFISIHGEISSEIMPAIYFNSDDSSGNYTMYTIQNLTASSSSAQMDTIALLGVESISADSSFKIHVDQDDAGSPIWVHSEGVSHAASPNPPTRQYTDALWNSPALITSVTLMNTKTTNQFQAGTSITVYALE